MCYHGQYFTYRPPFSKYTARTQKCVDDGEPQEYHIVADSLCLARFINHQEHKPNCQFKCDLSDGALYIDVVRSVQKDQQLCLDYGDTYFWDGDPVPIINNNANNK